MDAFKELTNLTHISPSAHAKKDKQRQRFYRNSPSNNMRKQIQCLSKHDSDEWQENDRRSGSDRRAESNGRRGRFEYRANKDRRKAKTLSVIA